MCGVSSLERLATGGADGGGLDAEPATRGVKKPAAETLRRFWWSWGGVTSTAASGAGESGAGESGS